MEIMAIFNAKGGVGKTTSTVNLAVTYAAMGLRVVVLDLDAQGNATSCLGINGIPETGAYDVIVGEIDLEQGIYETAITDVWLVPATENLATIDIDLARGELKTGVIRKILKPLEDRIDIVLLDCAPTFGTMTINALVSADWVLIPTQASSFAHDGLIRTFSVLGRIQTKLHPNLKIAGILPTFVDGGSDGEKEIMDAMRAEFGSLVDQKGIPMDAELFRSATAYGIPAVALSPDAAASRAYARIALNVVEPAFREALAAGNDLPAKMIGRICDITAPSAEQISQVSTNLTITKGRITEAGFLNERMNVPIVNHEAMDAEQMVPVPRGLSAGDNIGTSNVSVFAITLGVSFFVGALGFAIGWAVGAEKLSTLIGMT